MARQLRMTPPSGIHHITSRGNNQAALFADDRDRETFLAILDAGCERFDASVNAYCLMTNHVHLSVFDRRGELSELMQYITGVYGQGFNRRWSRTGHVFQGRFWSSLIEADSYLAVAVEYIHRNPVNASMVEKPEAYRWSSYRSYLGLAEPIGRLDRELVLGLYGGDIDLLRRSTERPRRGSAKLERLTEPLPAPVLGSDAFVTRALASTRSTPTTKSSKIKAKAHRHRADLASIASTAARVCCVEPASVTSDSRGSANLPKAVALLVAHRQHGHAASDVAAFFGMTSSSAVSMSCRRLEKRLAEDPAVSSLVRQVAEQLPPFH